MSRVEEDAARVLARLLLLRLEKLQPLTNYTFGVAIQGRIVWLFSLATYTIGETHFITFTR